MNIQDLNTIVTSNSMNFTACDASQDHPHVIYQAELCPVQIEVSGKIVTPNGEV